MSFGKAIPRQKDHMMLPKRDRSIEATHSKVPPVPRAPRPHPKPNSAGALARDAWARKYPASDSHVSVPSVPSEQRRPRNESPFARVNALTRERECIENQAFEIGPPRRTDGRIGEDKPHFGRGHILGKEISSFKGIHWSKVSNYEANDREPTAARRALLQRELKDAPQVLEWLPQAPVVDLADVGYVERDYSRRNVLAREAAKDDEQHLDLASREACAGYGRRNVLKREMAKEADTLNMPQPSGTEEGGTAPIFRRRRSLQQVAGIGGS
mmetsp:Transcript_46247/g.86328  ORF Transcript_46247/g.86328 Transcript_46247/m.86328 type:complete len:270 (+) Transcript_46247:41-850(+)